MKKTLGVSVLVIAVILVSKITLLAQPEAKKICFYPKLDGTSEIKLEELKPGQAVCFDDKGSLSAFNSATTSLIKFTMWQGGIIGTFTDKDDKVHLIRVSYTDAYIVEIGTKKVYTIDEKMVKKWYEMVNLSISKMPGLE